MHKMKTRLRSLSIITSVALTVSVFAPFLTVTASATSVSKTIVHLDRIKASTASTGWVCVMPSVATSLTTIAVTFPAGFTLAAAGSWASNNTANVAWPSGASGFTSVTSTPTSVTGQVVTWAISQTTPSTSAYYCLNWTAGLTSTGTAGASQAGSVVTSADATAKQYGIAIVSDDQIVINNTTVPPIFSMTFGGNTDGFSSNTINSVNTVFSTTGNNITIQTNAPSGWTVWAKSLNSSGGKGALNSVSAANYKITSASALASASHTYTSGQDYGLGATVTAGNGSPDAAYDGASTKLGVLDAASFRTIAADTGPTAATDTTLNIKLRAGISSQTPSATDYTDTITVVGAGTY